MDFESYNLNSFLRRNPANYLNMQTEMYLYI